MRTLSAVALLMVASAVYGQGEAGCVQLESGAWQWYHSSEITGIQGTDYDYNDFNGEHLNGFYSPLWVYHPGFGENIYETTQGGGGPNLDRGIMQIRVNYPSAGQSRLYLHGKYNTSGQNHLYATYTAAEIPGDGPIVFTVSTVDDENLWGFPGTITMTPCTPVPDCDDECDPECREELEDPCTNAVNPDVCDECWCDPAWRAEFASGCVDANENGVCDDSECECDPAIRDLLGDPCVDADENGECDDSPCAEEPCPDYDTDGICDDCDVDYRAEQEDPCVDENEDGECDECECDDCNPCERLDAILAILNRWDEKFNTPEEYPEGWIDPGITADPTGIANYKPSIDIGSPDWGSPTMFGNLNIPKPGSGVIALRYGVNPVAWVDYGSMPSADQLGGAVSAVDGIRVGFRFVGVMGVSWVFVRRVTGLLFNM